MGDSDSYLRDAARDTGVQKRLRITQKLGPDTEVADTLGATRLACHFGEVEVFCAVKDPGPSAEPAPERSRTGSG